MDDLVSYDTEKCETIRSKFLYISTNHVYLSSSTCPRMLDLPSCGVDDLSVAGIIKVGGYWPRKSQSTTQHVTVRDLHDLG